MLGPSLGQGQRNPQVGEVVVAKEERQLARGLLWKRDSAGGSRQLADEKILAALRGELSCSPKLASTMCGRLARLSQQVDGHAGALTDRQSQVADLVARECSNKEIARNLKIGPATEKRCSQHSRQA
jgi:DNA-binding NarL/FixJ family response regulator